MCATSSPRPSSPLAACGGPGAFAFVRGATPPPGTTALLPAPPLPPPTTTTALLPAPPLPPPVLVMMMLEDVSLQGLGMRKEALEARTR
jgi:hypothetical protein